MLITDLVSIAKIVKPQGNKGEVAADFLTDFPQRFKDLKKVFLEKDGQNSLPFTIDSFRFLKQRIIIKFSGVNEIRAAERLRNCDIKISKKEIVTLPPNSYYQYDLIDCVVKDVKGCSFGIVTDILEVAGKFLLSIQRSQKEILVPFAREIVLEVNLSKKELICNIPKGLDEL